MHILYVHQNFPAQFGHIADHLCSRAGHRCTFVSQTPPSPPGSTGIEKIQYHLKGGATSASHFCSRTFENAVWHTDAVHAALKSRPDVRPDLIVGHSGFGSTLFLRDLYGPDVPIINLFEYYYRPHEPLSDMDFRTDLNWSLPEGNYHRARCRNAMILLDLQAADLGYTPTEFQRTRFPSEYLPKLRTVFDGIDRTVYHGHDDRLRPPPDRRAPRSIAGRLVPASTRIVTYVSRGFESMRGFDVFMRAAKLIYRQHPDVLFVVVGTDRIAYGGDLNHLPKDITFKQWVMSKDTYDPARFHFTGRMEPSDLAHLLATSDLHVYLTVPFVLSWSMMDAMSAGAVVLASDTAPVQEMITHGKTGLLADFFSPEDFASKALPVLKDPAAHRPLGRAAEDLIANRYSLDAVLPQMLALYNDALNKPRRPESSRAVPASA